MVSGLIVTTLLVGCSSGGSNADSNYSDKVSNESSPTSTELTKEDVTIKF